MIDRNLLDAIKLVQEDNYNPTEIVEADLNHAISQGSQGWGVNRLIGTILTLARDLRQALDDAQGAQTDHNKLKGLQMEVGRLKKTISKRDARIEKLNAEILAKDILLKDLTKAAGSDIPSNEGVDNEAG